MSRMRLAVLSLLLASAASASAQKRDEFAVAEVRADGLLLPVAKWDGTRWHSLAMVKKDSVPYFARDGRWYYVAFSGARSKLKAIDAVSILTDDDDSWGFTTNLPARSFDPDRGTPRVGVATSDSVPTRDFRAASARDSTVVRAALQRLLDSVRTAGRRTATPLTFPDSFTVFTRPYGARLSAGVTLLSTQARIPIDTIAGMPYCPTIAAWDGWIIVRDDRADIQTKPQITDCEFSNVMGITGYVAFELSGRTFVFARQFFSEASVIVIYEWRDSKLTLAFEGAP